MRGLGQIKMASTKLANHRGGRPAFLVVPGVVVLILYNSAGRCGDATRSANEADLRNRPDEAKSVEQLQFEELPEHIQQNSMSYHESDDSILEEGLSLEKAIKDYERKLILEALEKSDGVKTKAAKLLNIKRTTLVEKIKKQNLIKAASAS